LSYFECNTTLLFFNLVLIPFRFPHWNAEKKNKNKRKQKNGRQTGDLKDDAGSVRAL
jgi:hypothetical protein